MAGQLRAIRQRIRGVQSIAKITRAQELIAASRIIKAQQRVRDAAPYAREITQAVEAVVSQSSNIDHPLVREPENSQRAAVLILSSDRGFAGGYNTNVMREAQARWDHDQAHTDAADRAHRARFGSYFYAADNDEHPS